MFGGAGWNVSCHGVRIKGLKRNRERKLGETGEKLHSRRSSVGVDLALGRLGKLHVFLAHHEPSQLQQHHADTVGVLPLGQRSHGVHVDHAVGSVHAVQVYLGHKSDKRWRVWVGWPTFNLQVVHPVLITCPWRAKNHSSPPRQGHVLVILQTPAHRTVSHTLLTLFQLLQKSEIAWNFNT